MTDPTLPGHPQGRGADPQLDEIVAQLVRIRVRLTVIVCVMVIPLALWLLAALTMFAV